MICICKDHKLTCPVHTDYRCDRPNCITCKSEGAEYNYITEEIAKEIYTAINSNKTSNGEVGSIGALAAARAVMKRCFKESPHKEGKEADEKG